MAYPSKTTSFVSGTTISASEVNTNFDDIFNGVSDGTKDVNVLNATFAGAIDCAGAAAFAGAITASSTASFTSQVYMESGATVASNMTVGGSLYGEAVQFGGAATFSAAVYMESGATVASNMTVGGSLYGEDVQFGGAATFSAAMTLEGNVYAIGDIHGTLTNNPYAQTATITGFTGTITRQFRFYARGKERRVHFYISASSGISNNCSFDLPTAAVQSPPNVGMIYARDDNTYTIGLAYNGVGATVTLYNIPGNANGWTNATTRTVFGTLQYEVS